MKLAEIVFFTDNVRQMTVFYRRSLSAEPVASSETMAIFFVNQTNIFIHRKYAPKNGEQGCEQLVVRGLPLEIPPRDFYRGRSACVQDPAGHQIEITSLEK